MRALGVDGCPAGWVGVVLESPPASAGVAATRAIVAPCIADLVSDAGTVEVIGVDMPIGLSDAGFRAVDLLARARLGRRRSSLFLIPPRPVLEEDDFATAVLLCTELTGKGVSRQAHGLRTKILELDAWLPEATCPVVEVHPELSFAEMSGHAGVLPSKRTWAGFWERDRLLRAEGIVADGGLRLEGAGGAVAPDDVLDAAAAAWTALRVARGSAACLSDSDEPGMALFV
jgi:predicted RNase H-like nuclease